MNYIVDEQIDLTKRDFLQTKQYADTLSNIIENIPKGKVFTIGLFGSWGTGKSSIIETSKNQLEQRDKKIKFITYDAWQYSKDSFRRMFLRTMQTELKMNTTDLMNKFYTTESRKIDYKLKFSIPGIVYVIVSLFLAYFICIKCLFVNPETKIAISTAFSFAVSMIALFSKAFDKLDISMSKPLLFAPEQFEDCFKEITDLCFEKENKSQKTLRYVFTSDKSIKNLEKLIIVIDNIDRCQGDIAYTLLSDIKTFLGNSNKNIVFIIPVDDEALKKQLFSKSKETDSEKEIDEFLRKSFNTVLRIKPYMQSDMFEFCKQIALANNCYFNSETLNLASKEYSKNPRRVIQLFNNLISELTFYEEDFAKKYQEIICACLIMKEEYYGLYRMVEASPRILLSGNVLDDNNLKKYNIDNNEKERIKIFQIYTKYIFNKVDINIIEKILTHSEEKFSILDSSVRTAINNFNFDSIKETYIDDSNQNIVLDYICDRLISDVKNNVKSSVINTFELISKLNHEKKINRATSKRFVDQFEIFQCEDFLYEIGNFDVCCEYIYDLHNFGFTSIKEHLVYYFHSEQENSAILFSLDYFKAFISVFNDEQTSRALAGVMTKQNVQLSLCENFNQNQFDWLIDNDLLLSNIEKIKNLQELNDFKDLFIKIFSNKSNIREDVFTKFFEKFNTIYIVNEQKDKIQLLADLENLNCFLDSIKTKAFNSPTPINGVQLINILHTNRRFRGNNAPAIISEAANIPEQLSLILNILYNLFRISNGKINISQDISVLRGSGKSELILEKIHKLYFDDKVELTLINNELFACFVNFDMSVKTDLLEYCCFEKKSDGNYFFSAEQIMKKIDNVLININLDANIMLLERLIQENRCNDLLLQKFVSQNSDFINYVSSKSEEISSFIISVFSDETKEQYKNNYILLTFVGQKGTLEQKNILRNLIVSRINEHNINIELLKLIQDIKLNSKQIIAALEDYIVAQKSIPEELLALINAIIGEKK